jgi:hypothetical protein
MTLHENILAFRGVQRLVESFDPMDAKADFPDISKLASAYKKASQQSDAVRAQADESPPAQKMLWQAHKAKKDAHAALVGRVVVDFPHLSAEDALHVAGKHIKQGNMQPFEHIGVLSDLWGARDHNEHGVTFNTPARDIRAAGFIKCLAHHHPEIQAVKKDMAAEGLTAVQFPGMEHVPPPEPEPDQEAPQDEPPPDEPQQQEAPQEAPAEEPQDQFSPQAAAEAFHIKPFRQFVPIQESAETASWAKVKVFKREADEIQQRAVAAHLRRDPAKESLYEQASDLYTQMQKAERDHLNKFGGRLDRRGK